MLVAETKMGGEVGALVARYVFISTHLTLSLSPLIVSDRSPFVKYLLCDTPAPAPPSVLPVCLPPVSANRQG